MYKIEVENIKCSGCANTIQKKLLKIDKVKDVSVDVENGNVVITGDADRDIIVNKLQELGYPEKGSNTVLHKAKSYVSCAIGKMKKNHNNGFLIRYTYKIRQTIISRFLCHLVWPL